MKDNVEKHDHRGDSCGGIDEFVRMMNERLNALVGLAEHCHDCGDADCARSDEFKALADDCANVLGGFRRFVVELSIFRIKQAIVAKAGQDQAPELQSAPAGHSIH